jgi:hypothetical protein
MTFKSLNDWIHITKLTLNTAFKLAYTLEWRSSLLLTNKEILGTSICPEACIRDIHISLRVHCETYLKPGHDHILPPFLIHYSVTSPVFL